MIRTVLVSLVILGGLGFSRPFVFQGEQTTRELVAPPASLVHFTFGYREAMADLLWIRSIQDFDYCEKKSAENLCQGNSWLFQTLDLITELSPLFRMAYSAGGMALTIIISDIEGASRLFDKAVLRFPTDWIILYKAAYHAIYEEKNNEKAARLMELAARHGAPDWVYALSTKLYTESGKRELAERLLHEMEQTELDPAILEAMRKKLAQ